MKSILTSLATISLGPNILKNMAMTTDIVGNESV
jgi:hypothetical protein